MSYGNRGWMSRSVMALVGWIQIEDMGVLEVGWTLQCHLELVSLDPNLPLEVIRLEKTGLSESNINSRTRLFVQPVRGSPLSFLIGRVMRKKSRRHTAEEYTMMQRTSVLVDAGNLSLVLSAEERVDAKSSLPNQGQYVQASGLLLCEPSFSASSIHSPVRARVTRIARPARIAIPGKNDNVDAIVRLDLDESIRYPKQKVCYYL